MSCVFFHRHSSDKIYSLKLYHQLNVTLQSKAYACNVGAFIRFYMQMRVEKTTKHLHIDSISHSHNSVGQRNLPTPYQAFTSTQCQQELLPDLTVLVLPFFASSFWFPTLAKYAAILRARNGIDY